MQQRLFAYTNAIKIGKLMAVKYSEKYNTEPSKHKQYVKGNYVWVNSYMEHDSDMMEQAIPEVVAKRTPLAWGLCDNINNNKFCGEFSLWVDKPLRFKIR